MYICLSNRSFVNVLAGHVIWTRVTASFCCKSRNRESRATTVEGDPWEKQRVREVRRTPVSFSVLGIISIIIIAVLWQEMGGRGVRNERDTPTTCVSQMWYGNIEKNYNKYIKKGRNIYIPVGGFQGRREI